MCSGHDDRRVAVFVVTFVSVCLFPAKLGDLTTKCSCPDWSNPCKHIAAVYYLLGEEFGTTHPTSPGFVA